MASRDTYIPVPGTCGCDRGGKKDSEGVIKVSILYWGSDPGLLGQARPNSSVPLRRAGGLTQRRRRDGRSCMMGRRGHEPRNASGRGSEKVDSLSPGASRGNQLCRRLALSPVILTVGPTFGTVREQIVLFYNTRLVAPRYSSRRKVIHLSCCLLSPVPTPRNEATLHFTSNTLKALDRRL